MRFGRNLILALADGGVGAAAAEDALRSGRFQRAAGAPPIAEAPAADHSCAIKDPSVVFWGGRWHLFATRRPAGPANMEYLSFADWKEADAMQRHEHADYRLAR